MVRREASEGQTLRLRRTNPWVMLGMFSILVATVVVCGCLMIFDKTSNVDVGEMEKDDEQMGEEGAYEDSENTEIKPEKIDFQPVIDEWVKSVNGNKSVLVYDLNREEIVGSFNTDKKYNTASLYKLFVVYEGYRRIESGEWGIEDPAGVTGYTIGKCLDLAIRESHSSCAETLWDKIGMDELDEIIETEYGITNSDISELISTPEDIAKMMQIIYKHTDIHNDNLLSQMKDSFLSQPATEYNWRQGLPSGFSDAVKVYNKVGWEHNEDEEYWNIYHDAAIVEFPNENRNFVVVVMTNKVPYQKIRDLGKKLEKVYWDNI